MILYRKIILLSILFIIFFPNKITAQEIIALLDFTSNLEGHQKEEVKILCDKIRKSIANKKYYYPPKQYHVLTREEVEPLTDLKTAEDLINYGKKNNFKYILSGSITKEDFFYIFMLRSINIKTKNIEHTNTGTSSMTGISGISSLRIADLLMMRGEMKTLLRPVPGLKKNH
jgi:hypothetical protein